MIKFENLEVHGWKAAIRGMRNPTKSWIESDSDFEGITETDVLVNGKVRRQRIYYDALNIGPEDMKFMKNLIKDGTDRHNFLRMINVTADITAPLYWWDDFKTIFTHNPADIVMDECSLFDGLMDKEFTPRDFSCEQLLNTGCDLFSTESAGGLLNTTVQPIGFLTDYIIPVLNTCREKHLEAKSGITSIDAVNANEYWWQIIQLLPSSYNQKRTVQMTYEVLANIYKSRKLHKLDEWSICFMEWIETLPYSELITMEFEEVE